MSRDLENQVDDLKGRLEDIRVAVMDEITEDGSDRDAMLKHFIRVIDGKTTPTSEAEAFRQDWKHIKL